jgi:hypothetical protein
LFSMGDVGGAGTCCFGEGAGRERRNRGCRHGASTGERHGSREGAAWGLGWGIFWAPWLGAGRSKTPAGDGGLVAGVGGGGCRELGVAAGRRPWRRQAPAGLGEGARESSRQGGEFGHGNGCLLPCCGRKKQGAPRHCWPRGGRGRLQGRHGLLEKSGRHPWEEGGARAHGVGELGDPEVSACWRRQQGGGARCKEGLAAMGGPCAPACCCREEERRLLLRVGENRKREWRLKNLEGWE